MARSPAKPAGQGLADIIRNCGPASLR